MVVEASDPARGGNGSSASRSAPRNSDAAPVTVLTKSSVSRWRKLLRRVGPIGRSDDAAVGAHDAHVAVGELRRADRRRARRCSRGELVGVPAIVLIAERHVRRRRRHQRQRRFEVAIEAAVALGAEDAEALVGARQLLDRGPALEARAVVVDDAGAVARASARGASRAGARAARIGVVGRQADRDRRVDGDRSARSPARTRSADRRAAVVGRRRCAAARACRRAEPSTAMGKKKPRGGRPSTAGTSKRSSRRARRSAALRRRAARGTAAGARAATARSSRAQEDARRARPRASTGSARRSRARISAAAT